MCDMRFSDASGREELRYRTGREKRLLQPFNLFVLCTDGQMPPDIDIDIVGPFRREVIQGWTVVHPGNQANAVPARWRYEIQIVESGEVDMDSDMSGLPDPADSGEVVFELNGRTLARLPIAVRR